MSSNKQFYNRMDNNIQILTIEKIIEYVYSDNFYNILLNDKTTFINNIESKIIEMIKANNKGNELKYNSDLTLYQKQKPSLISKYESDYSLLYSYYEQYKNNQNNIRYLAKYRKHCINSDLYPIHKCNTKNNTFGKFIEVKNINNKNENNDYVICTECQYCYRISFIKIFCSYCKCEYYSSKFKENEDENILIATWKEYHCNPIMINEKMKCIKCDNFLYLNLLTKNLVCLNKNCNFISNPKNIIWKCKICKKDFRALAKVYNPLEYKILQNEIWKSLIMKLKAKPKKLLCCLKKEKNVNINYYHNKNCSGELFKGIINGNDIVVCEKCHAVNFYDKFIWTCPKCNNKISNKKENKERKINDNKLNIQHKNNPKLTNENNNSQKNIIELNKPIKKTKSISNSKNNLIFKYFFTERKNNNKFNYNIYETEKKIAQLKKNLTKSKLNSSYNSYLNDNEINEQRESNNIRINKKNNFKKNKNYETLFDILEEREKYKLDNKSIEGNNEELVDQDKIKNEKKELNIKFNKRRYKLLEKSNKKTSKKNYRKIMLQQYLSPPKASNSKFININGNSNENIIKINLFNNNKSFNDSPRISSDEEKNKKLYKNLTCSKIYKDDYNNIIINEDLDNIEIIKKVQTNNKLNLDFKKAYLKEPDNTFQIDMTPRKKENKNMPLEDNKNLEKIIIQNLDVPKPKYKRINSNSIGKEQNQFLKRIYFDTNNIKMKDRLFMSKDHIKKNILKESPNPITNINININYINNKSEINISPYSPSNKSFISKKDFLNISNECKIPPFQEEDIQYINSIGIGSSDIIYLVEDKVEKKKYALKRVICQDISQILKIKKEFELVRLLNHPNIIKIYNIYFKYIDPTTYLLYFLMEKAESDWKSEIEKRAESNKFYTERELIDILKQLTDLLLYLQKKGIAHRNIKPNNILICENNIYKITDFGDFKKNNDETELSTLKGNQLFNNLYKNDVFSLGYCFLYAMSLDIKLIKNIREKNSMGDVISIINKYEMNNRYSDKFMNLIYKMIQLDENKRYDFFELLKKSENNIYIFK